MISFPVWFVLVLGFFAIIGVTDRVFLPSVRWYLRSRANRAIDELNSRLQLRIQPFKLTRRQSLIDQLLYDTEVVRAVEEKARADGAPRAAVMEQAARYAREIVPAFSAYAYFRIGARLAKWISTWVYRVRLGYSDNESLSGIDPEATVVFVMNHRSNMDYVLVTYMASASASLSYAVGEWARIWPLQNLIRSMGAYFIRRNSRDELYRKVLGRYVRMATREGVTQAVYPEGGLSRDGALRPPKLGLLSYMVSDFSPADQRDVVFVPVGINYDRVIEDRILTAAKEKELTGRAFRVSPSGVIRFFANVIRLRLSGRLYRYGYACVSFGRPLSLKAWLKDRNANMKKLGQKRRFAEIDALGERLMTEIGRVVPVLPVSLVAMVFLDCRNQVIGELELKSRVFQLADRLEAQGAHIHIPRHDRDYAVGAGLRMLTLRHLVTEENGGYTANPAETGLLLYYANSIQHLVDGDNPAFGRR